MQHVAQPIDESISLQLSQNAAHKESSRMRKVEPTPIQNLAPEIDVNHHVIHVHNINDSDQIVSTDPHDIGVVKVNRVTSQTMKTTKHMNKITLYALSRSKRLVYVETTKVEAIKGQFDVIMSTHEKIVADHFILKMQFQHLIDVFGKSIEDVLKVVKDRVNADHMEIHQHNQLENTLSDAYKNVQERNTNMRSRQPNLLRKIMRPHGCKTVCKPDIPSFDLRIST
ncbi:hypothetical protein Fot_14712 [Forsythia ovata]|uniref:Uncharacterized protein n=1 Tax=Forsythia ovata TaxID=205694 RepID=A0ABD1W754_9LAMI